MAGFPPAVRETLTRWFSDFASNPIFEIECRIHDPQRSSGVGAGGFDRLLSNLQSNRAWTNQPSAKHSLDRMHATGVRETHMFTAQPGPPEFMRKSKHEDLKVPTPWGFDVRFQVAKEQETSACPSDVVMYRHKERFTFEHKHVFKFELTRVKQGPTDAAARASETQHEVEIEFCGQQRPEAARPEYLADSLIMKVTDMLQQLSSASHAAAAPAAKRQRSANSPLQEGDEVIVAAGTEVALEPSGHGTVVRYEGTMPAELLTSNGSCWIFSHFETDGRAHIMSLPAMIGTEHFPLYYFAGTVPAAAVKARGQ
jgi:hypothetical protein